MPPISEKKTDWFVGLRQIIAAAISRSVPPIEKLLGFDQPNAPFRQGLSEAILLCVLRQKFPPKRPSQIAKQLKVISKNAVAAEENVRQLISRLENASGIYPPIKTRFLLKLREHTSEYASLSLLTCAHADALPDPGGRPELVAFRVLVERLIAVFKSATGTQHL